MALVAMKAADQLIIYAGARVYTMGLTVVNSTPELPPIDLYARLKRAFVYLNVIGAAVKLRPEEVDVLVPLPLPGNFVAQ